MPNAIRGPESPAEASQRALTTADAPNSGHRVAGVPTVNAPSVTQLVWTLLEYRGTVLLCLALAVGLAAFRLFAATPTYDESVLVQAEGRTKTVPGFTEVSSLFDRESATESEMRLMRSRPLLQSVVEELHLDLESQPKTFPLIGAAIARLHPGPGLAAPPHERLKSYAWGGERIAVARLEVPQDLLGKPLTVTALEHGRYEVATPDGQVILEGAVGKPATQGTGAGRSEILVSDLVARPATRFVVSKRTTNDVVDALQASLKIAEQGKATGVVELSLAGPDAARVAGILNAIARTYVRQNVERTSTEATKTLRFLEMQLPALKASMEKAEDAANGFRRDHGSVNLSFQGESLVTQAADMDKRISELQVEAAELHQRYSDTYPSVLAIEERLRSLRAQRAAMDQRMRTLPNLELESARLTRAARTATELFLSVQLRAQELRIVNAGWIGSVRILEPAIAPTKPSSPNREATIVLGLLLGIGMGIAGAVMRKGLEQGVADPDEIESGTGLPVFAAIPRSTAQRGLERRWGRRVLEPLSLAAPGDRAVEDLRSLRTSVQFALAGAPNNIVTISGPAPRVGKSFVSVNLAHLLAAAGRRVVLVDADLRRGQLQRYFGVERAPGLAEVLRGTARTEEAVRATDAPRLSFLSTGALPSNPAELAAGARTQEVLAELSKRFDVVIVDTPPILSVNDSALIARHAGLNLLVLRAGEQTVHEIAYSLKRLAQNGVTIRGAILNDLRPSRGRYGRYGEYPLYSTRS
jgi:tyrosine-protein kinase Etk/Wzc